MTEWTPEAIAAEEAKRNEWIRRGMCPDSGLTIRACISSDICDCFDHPEIRVQLERDPSPDA